MNNLDGNMMKEDDANMYGAELIKHVEPEINYTDTKVEHPLPLMCKWFYEFHKGNNKSDVSYIDENSSDVCSGSQKSMGSLAQTAIANTASGSSGWVVKIQHEKLADLRARSLVLRARARSLWRISSMVAETSLARWRLRPRRTAASCSKDRTDLQWIVQQMRL